MQVFFAWEVATEHSLLVSWIWIHWSFLLCSLLYCNSSSLLLSSFSPPLLFSPLPSFSPHLSSPLTLLYLVFSLRISFLFLFSSPSPTPLGPYDLWPRQQGTKARRRLALSDGTTAGESLHLQILPEDLQGMSSQELTVYGQTWC